MATRSSRAHDVKTALQRAKNRISSLEHELSIKESFSESEEELSLSTWTHSKELKDSLVDMYKANPKVNEELKQRLPSPVKQLATVVAADSVTPHRNTRASELGAVASNLSVPELTDWPQVPHHLQTFQESQTSRSTSPQRTSPSPISPRAPHPALDLGRRRSPSPISPRAPHPAFDPGRRRSLSPLSPRNPHPALDLGGQRSPSPLSSPRAPVPAAGVMEVDRPSSRSPLPRVDSFSEGGQGGGSRGPGSPVYRRRLVNTEASSLHQDQDSPSRAVGSPDSRKASPVLDRDKNISFLLKELDSLRDLNKRLQDKLAQREKELESKMVDAELMETEMEAQICEKAGALVEEIYAAQRDRDQAVMARLRLANEERDEALLRAKRLQQAAAELENINPEESDADVEELLNRVNSAESALAIEKTGAVIVDRIQKARQRRTNITAQEMSAVIEERDNAVARCKRLEQDLLQVREQSQTSANTQECNAHKEELECLQKERDMALEHNQRLEEEIQTLQANLSLHHSQSEMKSQPGSSLSSPNQSLQTSNQASLPRDGASLLGTAAQQQPLLLQLQQLAREHQITQAQLQRSQEAEREATERVQKLERLVEVLRKKVGTGNVRTVI